MSVQMQHNRPQQGPVTAGILDSPFWNTSYHESVSVRGKTAWWRRTFLLSLLLRGGYREPAAAWGCSWLTCHCSREEANQSQPGFFEVHWTSVESQPSVPTASVSAGHYVMLDPLLHRVQLLKTWDLVIPKQWVCSLIPPRPDQTLTRNQLFHLRQVMLTPCDD